LKLKFVFEKNSNNTKKYIIVHRWSKFGTPGNELRSINSR